MHDFIIGAPSRPLARLRRVFSGRPARPFWKLMGRAHKKPTVGHLLAVVDEMAWRCQELEELVRALEERLATLEDR